MKRFIPLVLVIVSFLMLYSCGSGDQAQSEKLNQSGPEYTSNFICPMRCPKSGSAKMGTCPVCHMDYVQNKEQKDFEQTH